MRGTRNLVLSLVFVGVLVLVTLVGFATGWLKPLLGLDLTGGVSVVLQGPSNVERDVMEQALEKIRQRVDTLGVAEPDISLLGSNTIQVQLPGLGGQGTVRKVGANFCVFTAQDKQLSCYRDNQVAQAKAKELSIQRVLDLIGQTARLTERPVLAAIPPSTNKSDQYNTVTLNPGGRDNAPIFTFIDDNNNGRFDKGKEPIYQLGPVVITGANLTKATAVFVSGSTTNSAQAGWQVDFTLDSAGSAAFSKATTELVAKQSPQNQLAILLDGVVQGAPPQVVSAITDGRGSITGNFSESRAKDLGLLLQSGALPVQLTRLQVETVSPTLGTQSLHQGLIAGLVGLIALALYLAFYYRLLGMVTWVGMAIWATLALGLVSVLGRTAGYSLSLAGIAGLIVSLGITADSYIVFYERLKDEDRQGKTIRAAVQPAFKRAWRTIVAADVVTAIAAAVLYVVSIGSVRGFALTLGLSTLLDLFVVWFFKRPTVFLMARSERLTNLRGIGLRSAMAEDEPEPALPAAAVAAVGRPK
jgi:preprotein translocase subunit SecD